MSCITEILKLKGKKKFLLDNEDSPFCAIEGGGFYRDHEYLIIMNKYGIRCGYIAIKNDHKYHGLDYDEIDIRCHGGLTFSGNDHIVKNLLKNKCTDYWIGFDCGHCYDLTDIKKYRKYFLKLNQRITDFIEESNFLRRSENSSVKDYSYLENECKSIIDQLVSEK